MSEVAEKHYVVLKENGFLSCIKPKDKKSTDKVLFEGTPEECEGVIHGKGK